MRLFEKPDTRSLDVFSDWNQIIEVRCDFEIDPGFVFVRAPSLCSQL